VIAHRLDLPSGMKLRIDRRDVVSHQIRNTG
jgi:hypothetical protein